MSTHLYRIEPGRYFVTDICRGLGSVSGSGESFQFRGVDASQHGFGCIVSRYIEKGSSVLIPLGHHHMAFDVVWCESHLGIENMYRIGLISKDPNVNVELLLQHLGYLELVTKQAS